MQENTAQPHYAPTSTSPAPSTNEARCGGRVNEKGKVLLPDGKLLF